MLDSALEKSTDLNQEDRASLVGLVLDGDLSEVERFFGESQPKPESENSSWISVAALRNGLKHLFSKDGASGDSSLFKKAQKTAKETSFKLFLAQLPDYVARVPELLQITQELVDRTHSELSSLVETHHRFLFDRIVAIQTEECTKQVEREATSQENELLLQLKKEILQEIEALSMTGSSLYVFPLFFLPKES